MVAGVPISSFKLHKNPHLPATGAGGSGQTQASNPSEHNNKKVRAEYSFITSTEYISNSLIYSSTIVDHPPSSAL